MNAWKRIAVMYHFAAIEFREIGTNAKFAKINRRKLFLSFQYGCIYKLLNYFSSKIQMEILMIFFTNN